MNSKNEYACYGSLFPDLLQGHAARREGHAFRCTVGPNIAFEAPRLRVEVKEDAWDACTRCERFADCYKLSLGKLELQKALLVRN